MPYAAGTNRKAKDFSKYIAQRLKAAFSNVNMRYFDNTITTGTDCVNTCAVAAKNTLITGYETDFANSISAWSFTKNASNYLIGGDNGAAGFEFYPPEVIREDATTWIAFGKVNNEIWGTTSSDGVTWAAPSKFIDKGTSGQWDDLMNAPTCFRKDGSTYKCFYSAYGDSPVYNYKIGLATKSAFTAGSWTKSPSYIYDVTDYNTANGTSWDGIQLSDIVLVGDRYYYFGQVFTNAFTSGELCYGIGEANGDMEDIILDTKIASFSELNPYYTWFQSMSVFKHPTTGVWYATCNGGVLINDATTNNQVIYHFNSGRTDAPIFTADSFKSYQVMAPDLAKAYENSYNYNGNWVKDNDGTLTSIGGAYYFYYGGHENTATPTYTGVTCLATITTIP